MTPLQKNILAAVKRRPMTLRELQNNLQVDNSRLRTSVSAMVATGELAMKNGTYVPGFATYENPTAPGGSIPCTLVKLAARFGFASRDDGEGDIFIPGRALHGAMPNDKILVKLFDHPRVEGSSEGEVLEVTVPNNRFVGTDRQLSDRSIDPNPNIIARNDLQVLYLDIQPSGLSTTDHGEVQYSLLDLDRSILNRPPILIAHLPKHRIDQYRNRQQKKIAEYQFPMERGKWQLLRKKDFQQQKEQKHCDSHSQKKPTKTRLSRIVITVFTHGSIF